MGRAVRALRHSWNRFANDRTLTQPSPGRTSAFPIRNGRPGGIVSHNGRNIVSAIVNRMAVDAASVEFYHARVENRVAQAVIEGPLNDRLTHEANLDQSAFDFKVDLFHTMFDHGHAAIVPIDFRMDPSESASFKIDSMRVGRVVSGGWHPRHVMVEVWDDREHDSEGAPVDGGIFKQILVPKTQVALVTNPFFHIMNEPNSVLQRLQRKLHLLDQQAEEVGTRRLDIIFQTPYTTRSEKRMEHAERRRSELRQQLREDELGVGQIDVQEKVIQLNRPINSQLLEEVRDLKEDVFAELGVTPGILNNTADRTAINGYYDRTIEPACTAAAAEMKRKFISKTARTQGQSIEIYRDPLKLIPIEELAELVDKLQRNATVSANEIRPKIGFFPSSDPSANRLVNPNMPVDDQTLTAPKTEGGE